MKGCGKGKPTGKKLRCPDQIASSSQKTREVEQERRKEAVKRNPQSPQTKRGAHKGSPVAILQVAKIHSIHINPFLLHVIPPDLGVFKRTILYVMLALELS